MNRRISTASRMVLYSIGLSVTACGLPLIFGLPAPTIGEIMDVMVLGALYAIADELDKWRRL